MNRRDKDCAPRQETSDFDLRPAQIYAEAAATAQQQKLHALGAAMQSLLWKPPRRDR